MDNLYLFLLGTIQGLAEFLPISSKSHLLLLQYFLGWPGESPLLLDVTLHFGTLCATIVYFRETVLRLIREFLGFFTAFSATMKSADGKLIQKIILSSIPTAVIGFTLKPVFEANSGSLFFLDCGFLITGLLLIISERMSLRGRVREEVSFLDALLVGCVQGVSVLPGISRSGSTIAYLLVRRYSLETAFKYSFLISMPAVMGAVILEGHHALKAGSFRLSYLFGAAVACISGLFALRFLKFSLKKRKFRWYGYYLLVLCAAIAGYLCLARK
ncbi:MAG: undecaprenyl-diphosphate phosphatase [Candidatus Wallbacteria bacterium]|nr:undecaprenyl-diphosphate phosphatase [Candidatus Wallbacteria bacterium]